MYSLITFYGLKAKNAMRKLLTNERGEVNVVAIVVLIAVAVVLAIFLKDRIAGLIEMLINNIAGEADKALDAASPVAPTPTP